MVSHQAYLAEQERLGRAPAAVFKIWSLRVEGVLGGAMHTMDQGVTSHVVGNILCEVMDLDETATTQAQRAANMHDSLEEWYKANKVTCRIDGKLTYIRVKKSGDWPKFLGKAAATRHLVPFALMLARMHNSGSDHDRLRLGAIEALDQVYKILYNENRFLSSASRASLVRLSQAFFCIYTQLASEAVSERKRAWKMTPKFHLFQHILEHQAWINPRAAWEYADEDLQRILKEVAQSCHSNNTPFMVLLKWVVSVFDI